jgi:hypothetical protein
MANYNQVKIKRKIKDNGIKFSFVLTRNCDKEKDAGMKADLRR